MQSKSGCMNLLVMEYLVNTFFVYDVVWVSHVILLKQLK